MFAHVSAPSRSTSPGAAGSISAAVLNGFAGSRASAPCSHPEELERELVRGSVTSPGVGQISLSEIVQQSLPPRRTHLLALLIRCEGAAQGALRDRTEFLSTPLKDSTSR